MKILIDARLYGLENAGLGRYINNLVDGLAKIDQKNNYVILLRKEYFNSLMLPSNWKKVLADYSHYGFLEQIMLPRLISKENPDLVHFPHFNVPILYNGSYIVTIHDMLMHQQKGMGATTLSMPFYFIKRLAYHLVFKTAVTRSNAILVPSSSVKTNLLQEYPIEENKITVTYEGIDQSIIANSDLKIDNPYFVYVGNAYPHKNLKRLIQAIVGLNTNNDRLVLLVIVSARNVFTQRLEQSVKDLKAEEFVKLMGFVSDGELGTLFTNSVGFVFPSLSEGFGLPGLEAINSGTLLLAADIPVFREIYGSHSIYFNPLDFSSIEKSMRDAMKISLVDRKKMVVEGQKFAKRYSWAKMAEETLDVYKKVSK